MLSLKAVTQIGRQLVNEDFERELRS